MVDMCPKVEWSLFRMFEPFKYDNILYNQSGNQMVPIVWSILYKRFYLIYKTVQPRETIWTERQ
jgi:hypothetical protein